MSLMETPTKDQIQQIVTVAARTFNFNPDCQQNLQSDVPGHIFYDDGLNYEDEEDDTAKPTRLSASQKNMVCNLRKVHSKPDSVIAELIRRDVSLISAARCK